jgi:hypothetical protein
LAIVRAEKEQRALVPATALCPDNGTLSALRSLLEAPYLMHYQRGILNLAFKSPIRRTHSKERI